MKYKVLVLALLSVLATLTHAAPLDTAFTYQGRLDDSLIPATGLYDFNFKLFDADTGGGQISPAAGVSVNAVGVTNGVFSVTLDFGAAFNGEKRWLDMAVNTNAARPLGALAPRQPVQAAPYALYALKAAQADTAAVASSVANAAVSSASLANSAVTGQKIANGTVVRSVNGLTDGLTIAAGTNITLGTAGNTLTISAVSGSCPCPPAWLLNGNSGTDPNNNFLGTIDNQALTVRVNNLPALRLIPDASIRVNDLDPNLNIVEPQVSANLVGGYTNNFVSPDNKGATIAGGGSHYDHVFHGASSGANIIERISDYSFIGSGSANYLTGPHNAIVGGHYNRMINANYGFIGAGGENLITTPVDSGAIVGGVRNTVTGSGNTNFPSGDAGFIGAGHDNVVTNHAAFIGAGANNFNAGDYASVVGGRSNRIEGVDFGGEFGRAHPTASTIAGGERNTVSGLAVDSAILGGAGNTVTAPASSVLAGERNRVDFTDSVATGNGAVSRRNFSLTQGNMFATPGDGQSALYTLAVTTSGTNSLLLIGPRLPTGSAFAFSALVSAKAFGDASAGFEIKGLIRNYGTQVAIVGTPIMTPLGRDAALGSATITAEVYLSQLAIRVSSGTALNVRWIGSLQTSEVQF